MGRAKLWGLPAAPAAVLSLSVSLALAACGSDGDAAANDVPEDLTVVEGPYAQITALDNSFRPENVQVEPGTEVTWANRGRDEHDIVPVEGDGWGVEAEDFAPDDDYSTTFTEPGVHRYYCSLHGTAKAGMIGTIVVADQRR